MVSNETFPIAIVAVAGRRIDAADAQVARFPLKNVPSVRNSVAAALQRHHATVVVSSAACGADLIALDEAERLGLRRRIILPFSSSKFREKSVTDRPGNWGSLYDHLVSNAEQTGDLVVLDTVPGDSDAAYVAATMAIIQEAQMLAQSKRLEHCDLVAITIWDGTIRGGDDDITNKFRTAAVGVGFKDIVIPTL